MSMMTDDTQSVEHKYELITRDLQEVLGADIVRSVLAQGKNLKCYWGTIFNASRDPSFNGLPGTAPTGKRELAGRSRVKFKQEYF
jgi:hypothetical protein